MPYTLQDFRTGQRVQMHPGTDRWMRGDRYGEVVAVGRRLVTIKLDRSGQTKAFLPRAIGEIL
jgi:hypothetical protein